MPSKPKMPLVLELRPPGDSTLLQHTTGPVLHCPPPEPWLGSGADVVVGVGVAEPWLGSGGETVVVTVTVGVGQSGVV